MKTKFLLFVSVFSMAIFTACTNEPVNEASTSSTISIDETITNSEIDATVDDVSIIAEDQFNLQKSSSAKTIAPIKSMLPLCAKVTADLTNTTWIRTIDFGTQGCTIPNGSVLKGKIIISSSKDFTTPLKSMTYKLEGFYHNDKLIEGSKTITYELKNSDLLVPIHPVITHSIDLKITAADGTIYSRTGTRVREMVEGYETTSNWEDNVFKIWGNHSTAFPNGTILTSTTLKAEAHLIKMSCKLPFPVSGITEIVKNDASATLNFGNGECDKLATMTINGVSKEIVLKK
jgi:hypothetical protein